MSVRHTEINIVDAIMAVLCEFSLSEKALAITTDNASSMISCSAFISEELEKEFDNLYFSHYRCVAHILNLAVTKRLEVVNESVEKVRSLMIFIKAL